MESSSDYALIEELREMRPAPSPAFAAELDERAATGFPRRPRRRHFADRIKRAGGVPRRRVVLPAAGFALAMAAVVAVVVLGDGADSKGPQTQIAQGGLVGEPNPETGRPGHPSHDVFFDLKSRTHASPEVEKTATFPDALDGSGHFGRHLPAARLIRYDAELSLAAAPGTVDAGASQVFSTVRRFGGIVTSSTISEGLHADAYFSLLIPSNKLPAALDALSQIDRVRSREESTADVTASAVSLTGGLKESEARLESLLAQLSNATTDTERRVVEAELRSARRRVTAQRARLAQLHRNVHFSRVEVGIRPEKDVSGGGSWGVGDALHDAGNVLSAAAGVLLIALAVLGPLALIALLAWLARRAWLSRARRRALG